MKQKLLLLFALVMSCMGAWAKVLYASLDGTAMTIYCADSKPAGDYYVYTVTTGEYGESYADWRNPDTYDTLNPWVETITTVTIDASCSDYDGTSLCSLFYNLKDLTSITGLNNLGASNVTDMSRMFSGCKLLPSIELNGLNTSKVTNMYEMFAYCENLTSIDVSPLNTSEVTDMTAMFWACNKLATFTFGGSFDTSKVQNMYGMFLGCDMTTIDLSTFDTSNVTNMLELFQACQKLTSIDLSSFNTSKVTNMCQMFFNCSLLSSITFGPNFVLDSAENIMNMFAACPALETLDISNFNTSTVTEMRQMFSGCTNLTTIKIGTGWDTSNVTEENSNNMFYNCSAIVGEDGTTYNSSNTNKNYAHADAGGYLTLTKAKANEVGTEYWSTFYKTLSNYEVDANTTVYTATQSGTTLTLHEVGNRIIKAGEGVILKSTNPTISLTKTVAEPTSGAYDGNVLKGVNAATAQTSGTTYYVLGYKDSHLAFYKYKSDLTLGAHKAYIPVTSDPSREYIDINIDGLSTGISVVEDVKGKMDGVFYDLSGRRVLYPTKGLYIVNGKKVIIK